MDFQMVAVLCENRLRADIMTEVAQFVFPLVPCPRREKGPPLAEESREHLVMVETMAGGQSH